ncbi:capsular biosynthesis protein CpsI [Hyphomicrobium methylovorum]|uniref:NAD-dependent epimerase n=1 Tax=Hyphomicrobium methylovorum TaxID=84 RepID=UPI0015E74281|nr:NAD-dependent epimerase [Hyphomicrobium methylovorum]MBA2125974.1 capsular biosynthesis protein CpsI [Hyphomicrobium methylovorum]
MKFLVTGAAGFIGYHTAMRLLDRGDEVVGVDNVNDYYDPALKEARLARLVPRDAFTFFQQTIADRDAMAHLFKAHRPDKVIHLAAQAGVRYGSINPDAYVDSNLVGTQNILEGCRRSNVAHLVLASSSSVYGANTKMPFSVHDNVDHPLSLYAATKKANELSAHAYAHLYGLPVTALRFFTVYGPWGRPDMALFLFTRKILAGEPIEVFNNGHHSRDFTYIDDIVEGVLRVADRNAAPNLSWSSETPDPATSSAPYRVYNIGNNAPVALLDFIGAIESALGREAKKVFLPLQPGDVPATFADIDDLVRDTGFRPSTPLKDGITRFTDWYRSYYG